MKKPYERLSETIEAVPMKRLDPILKAERDIELIDMFDKLSESDKSAAVNWMKSRIEN